MSDRTTPPSSDAPFGRAPDSSAELDGGAAGAWRDPHLDSAAVHDLREKRLFLRAAEGDRDAIAEVWCANRRWIAAVLAAHTPRGVDLDDLLQEVAATLVAKAHHLRDAASIRGWLRVVAINVARMHSRSRAVETRAMHTLGEARRVSPPSDAVARDARETLALLSQLPPQYAEPLILQATQGLSQRQIAALLDVPETTVETRLARGRRMFRNLSEETHGRVAAARSMSSDRRTSHDA